MKNHIYGIKFKRKKNGRDEINLLLTNSIPPFGYSPKELRKLLKDFERANSDALEDRSTI